MYILPSVVLYFNVPITKKARTEKKPLNGFSQTIITLTSGIGVGPRFINFGFFSRPYGLIREYIKLKVI